MDTMVKSHCVATHKKNAPNELFATQKSETRVLKKIVNVADRQQRKALAVHHCILASQSPLTGSGSGAGRV